MIKNRAQQGFGILGILAIILVLGIVGFSGWKLYDLNKQAGTGTVTLKPSTQTADTTSEQSTPAVPTPEGYIVYSNSNYGFSFAYPKEYGSFAVDNTYLGANPNAETTLISDDPPASYSETGSIGGKIVVKVGKSGNLVTTTRKYGPTVKLQSGQWIVSDDTLTATSTYKNGDVYKNLDGAEVKGVQRGATVSYVFHGGDEGCVVDKVTFMANDRLVDINLPSLCDATQYFVDGDNDKAPTQAEKDVYASINKNVPESIKVTR